MKVAFKWWPREANENDNFFRNALKKFDIEFVSEKDADVIFFSTFNGVDSKKMPSFKSKATKVFWSGENCKINMKKCDYAFGFAYEEEINDDKYMRLPLYVCYGAGKNLLKNKKFGEKFAKRKFCSYIYSKDALKRVELFSALGTYKKIDAPGRSMNNSPPITPKNLSNILKPLQFIESTIGNYSISSLVSRHSKNWRSDVINYQSNYKFCIAFENSERGGYTTEKIYHPMLARSVPIYWGNPEIFRDFNTKSFVNYYDYNDMNKLVDVVIDLDQNDKKYLKMLNEPWLKKNKLNKWMDINKIEKQLGKILE